MSRGIGLHRAGSETPAGLPPVGPAGGDLSGSYPNPVVDGLQGRPVSAAVPALNDVLAWSGAAWAPTAVSTAPSGPAGGNLAGTYPNPAVASFTGAGGAPGDFLPTDAAFAPADNVVDIGSQTIRVRNFEGVAFIARGDTTNTIKATLGPTGLVGTTSFTVQAATTLALERAGGGELQLTSGGALWRQNAVNVRTDVLASAGAVSYTHVAGITGITYSQAQSTTGVGATTTFRAQRGLAGSNGGIMEIGGGDAGTIGAQINGQLRLQLGDTDASNDSARLSYRFGGTGERGWLQHTSSGGVNCLWQHTTISWIIASSATTKLAGSVATGVQLRNAADTVTKFQINDTGIGYYAAAPVAQPTITGSKVSGAALADMLTKVALSGFWIDGTSA